MSSKKNKPQKIQATQAKNSQTPDLPKRSFLKIIWTSLGAVAVAEIIFLSLSFLFPTRKKKQNKDQDLIVPAGSVENYAPETITAFTRGFFYLVCLEDGGFMAYSSKCTHLGCTLPWDDVQKKFICPCHASSFDIYGQVLSTPAPRPLDRYTIKIENKMIYVDTGRKLKRQNFDPKDVVYADQVKTGNTENQEPQQQ